jgi:assimilatory nitrate reductase catalytic subunit
MTEEPSEAYPLMLLTGRGSAAQWHTETRTKKSPILRKLYPPTNYAEINPADARTYGITANSWIYIESQRGRIKAKAFLTPTVAPGQVFVPMHDATTNQLTYPSFDPYSKQPAYKGCAVRIRPIRE